MLPLKDNLPTLGFPVLTVALIVINVAVFIWQLSLSDDPGTSGSEALQGTDISARDEAILQLGAIPARITEPGRECEVVPAESGGPTPIGVTVCEGSREARQVEEQGVPGQSLDDAPWFLTLVTSMFLHGDILHIVGNMLFLWVFGNNIEASMGRGRFALFYLLAGLVAVYAQAALDPSATGPTIGASGAIAGVLGGYALLHPQARILTLVFVIFFVTLIEIPALVMLGIWFVLQALPAVGQLATPDVAGSDGVAYLAHVGGFLFGLAAIKLFANRRPESGPSPPYPVY